MKLSRKSFEWAFAHLLKENDTDLFPEPIELEVMESQKESIISKLESLDVGSYEWKSFRRFMIPKAELSYRMVTQLDPLDSVMMSAIIYEYGQQIEAKRIPTGEKRVFSYRFAPENDGTLYSRSDSWKEFWTECLEKSSHYDFAVYLDISDFYNQIYHHTIDNMMINAGIPNEINKSVMKLLEHLTQKMSRGIPVGPHAAHLIAEMSLIPVDESLQIHGIDYCRYSDDIIIFANSEVEARTKTYTIAQILDQNQRLMLQKQKTKMLSQADFSKHANQMLSDNPMDIQETEMIDIIKRHSNNNPYVRVQYDDLTEEEIVEFSQEKVEALINKYVTPVSPDYSRLRWLFRRFSQVGTASAVEYCISNMDKLIPAISDVCQYLIAAADCYGGDWESIGQMAVDLIKSDLFKSSEFFQITLLNLFVKNTKIYIPD